MAHHDPGEQVGSKTQSLALVVLALAAFSFPGVPLAWRWFKGPEAWLVGSCLGYLGSSIVASVLYRFELASPSTILLSSIALCSVGLASRGVRSRDDSGGLWLAASCCVALVIVALPFSRVGSLVADGVAYRAYFSADLMTHLSVVAELQKGEFPLTNPFYAGGSLGYYWLFFVFPATFGSWATNQSVLLITYVGSGVLFCGLLFCALRRLELPPARAFAAVCVVIGAVGYEGCFALVRSEPWSDINVDALSRWVFELVSLDGLHRALLYTPQHSFSYSLLIILILLMIRGEPKRASGAALCGVLLGGMAGASIVTAMLAGPWMVLVLWRRRRDAPFLTTTVVAAATSFLFLGWYVALGFFDDTGGALTLRVPRLLELPSVLLVDAGALFLLAVWRWRRRMPFDIELLWLAALALAAVLVLDLRGYEGVWIAWRAGSVLLVALGLVAVRQLRPVHIVIVAPAVLTLVLDVYNASDVTNRKPSPGGFPWTTVVHSDELEALTWIRDQTPLDAVVQWDVRARQLGEWALLPALGERRMAVGFPIFLLDLQKYRVRERRQVRPIFNSGDADEAYRLASELGIDYIVIGAQEIQTRGERVRPLFEAEERFRVAFSRGETAVLVVLSR